MHLRALKLIGAFYIAVDGFDAKGWMCGNGEDEGFVERKGIWACVWLTL